MERRALLAFVDRWRRLLASRLVLDDPTIAGRDLDLAVRRAIIRAISLHLSRARGLPDGRADVVTRGGPAWSATATELSTALAASDDFPHSHPLTVESLGVAYEHLMAHGTPLAPGRLVARRRAVQKTAGVFYTPPFVVDYVVAQTVDPLLRERSPDNRPGTPSPAPLASRHAKEGAAGPPELRVLDPACGAGAFLVGAYRHLLAWYRDRYAASATLLPGVLRLDAGGRPWLTLPERRRVLLDHLFGLDLDPAAVGLARLSLLLVMLEDTSHAERAALLAGDGVGLPDLADNVKCGDALLGPDFAPQADPALASPSEHPGGTDWPVAFPAAFRGPSHGFAAVIGNPPYVFGEFRDPAVTGYLRSHFALAKEQFDLYWLFLEQGLRLTARAGRLGMVVPDALLARDEATAVRAMLLDAGLARVLHCGAIFPAGVSAVVVTVAEGARPDRLIAETYAAGRVVVEHTCAIARFRADPARRLLVHAADAEAALLARLQHSGMPLSTLVRLSRGEEMGKRAATTAGPIPILTGGDVSRYRLRPPSLFVAGTLKNPANYRAPKIVLVKTGRRCVGALDNHGWVTMQSLYNVHLTVPGVAAEAVLAILNSALMRFYVFKTTTAQKLLFPQLNQATVLSLPVAPDFARRQEPLVESVRELLSRIAALPGAPSPAARAVLEREIAAADHHLDGLVYDLYGLSDGERSLVADGDPLSQRCHS